MPLKVFRLIKCPRVAIKDHPCLPSFIQLWLNYLVDNAVIEELSGLNLLFDIQYLLPGEQGMLLCVKYRPHVVPRREGLELEVFFEQVTVNTLADPRRTKEDQVQRESL